MNQNEKKVDKVLLAVIQSQDSEMVEMILEEAGYSYTKLPSAGGFLREKNVTFLIGCTEENRQKIIDLLASSAKKRVSYVATPLDNASFPIVIPAETMIGGVNVFTLDIEHYEEI